MMYSCRFIFVDFNAWEYVGCDVLWAGIVTNLASAIEAEFGVMTSRIFRLLNVDVIQDDASSNERTLLFDDLDDQNDQKLKEILKNYGVVKECVRKKERLEVEYTNHKEAINAYKAMKSNGIKVRLNPTKKEFVKKRSCTLFCHFCKHFVKNPKTTLGLPNLYWFLLFYLAFICLLFIASQVANTFDLDINRVSLKTLSDVVFIQREV